MVSITVIYHTVSLTVFMLCLTVLRNTLVSITVIYHAVIDTNVLRNTVRDTACR
jgi:hypothetical protein